MKILNNIPKILDTYNKNKISNKQKVLDLKDTKSKEISNDNAIQKDAVSISSDAKYLNIALKALKNIPDVREDKVKELTEKIESGTYHIDSRKIAEKILNS